MKYILLSYQINEDTPVHKSLPMPGIIPYSQISKGDDFNSVIISIHNHTGTHIDAPKHFLDDGKLISEYHLDELVFKKPVMVDCLKRDGLLIIPENLQHASQMLKNSDCLLLHTGFGQYRSEERYLTFNPGIASETIQWIREEYPNIRCIGIDSVSISSFQHRNDGVEAHKVAFRIQKGLGEPLLLIEDMNLSTLSNSILKSIIVLPWQVSGIDGAPCTVLAEIE
jgi:kynurenine formamidase